MHARDVGGHSNIKSTELNDSAAVRSVAARLTRWGFKTL